MVPGRWLRLPGRGIRTIHTDFPPPPSASCPSSLLQLGVITCRKEYFTHAVVMLLTFSPVGENVEVFNSPVLHFLSTGNISQKFEKWQLAVKHYFSSFSQHVLNGVKFKYFITGNPSQLKCPISQ